MEIKGFVPMSLVDYPGKVCSVIFLSGCNFRCGFCHNPELIAGQCALTSVDSNEILDYLKEKKKWIDGVCITGGEPTLYNGLPELIEKIRGIGLLVKLDTNGTNPAMLKSLIGSRALDYIAMDIKAPLEKYELAAGAKVRLADIEESARLVRESGIDYEFRTTVLPALHSGQDILKISEWLRGSRKYFLQQFRAGKTLDPKFHDEKSFSKDELQKLRDIAKPFFGKCEIRF